MKSSGCWLTCEHAGSPLTDPVQGWSLSTDQNAVVNVVESCCQLVADGVQVLTVHHTGRAELASTSTVRGWETLPVRLG